jgi:Lrp/AsnC family leucine-responsive transcriptional regulator
MIDAQDREILKILQQNARTSNAGIARQLGMAPSAILERIRKLEARGVIQGYEARIDPQALGLGLLAFVSVRDEGPNNEGRVGELLARMPEVQEVHHIAGEDCFLVKVRTADAKSLGRLLREGIAATGPVRTRTTVVLETLYETSRLPIDPGIRSAGGLSPAPSLAEAAIEVEEVAHA